jgi:general secretion pathway protein G
MKTQVYRAAVQRGFTLIELLLVLVILAVLAVIVVPKFAGRTEDARKTAARTQVSAISSAIRMFEVDVGRYPSNEEGLHALMEAPGNAKGWRQPYLEQALGDDPWGNPYGYKMPGTHNPSGFDVYSIGPDGTEGSDDDIGNWQAAK